jgi:hypothetical protein
MAETESALGADNSQPSNSNRGDNGGCSGSQSGSNGGGGSGSGGSATAGVVAATRTWRQQTTAAITLLKNESFLNKFRSTKLDQQNQESSLRGDSPTKEESSDMEVRLLTKGLESQEPIEMVDECPWSPGVYQLLCLLG